MNVINAVNCVHYDQKDEIAKERFDSIIKEKGLIGYVIGNDIKVIKNNNNMNAYRIVYSDNKIIEESI